MSKSPITFVKEVKTELNKVVWPSRAEAIRLTTVVILASVFFGFFIGGLDIFFLKMVDTLLK